jgi:hypothetical protein
MMMEITVFNTEKTKQGGKIEHYETFNELAKKFSNFEVGQKNGSGFIRGKLDPPTRKNENRCGSELLIIDGDTGRDGGQCVAPQQLHLGLVEQGINHFIYTSHSHTIAANKFRCVVHSEYYETDNQLKRNIEAVIKKYDIKFVKEMKAWSQIWFDPRRSDNDGLFEFYEYHEGNKWSLIDEQEVKSKKETNETERSENGDTETLDDLQENIRTGTEYHESLRTLSYQYVKDGMSKPNAKAILRVLMNGSQDSGSKRWQERYDEIDRLVDKIDKDDEEFDLENFGPSSINDGKFPKPPGLLGDLYKAAYSFLLLQSEEVAIASSLGVVAAIVGRKFNTSEPMASGLNLFLTIIANTGCGKDRINDFIRMCLNSANDGVKSYDSFIAPSHFYGPKAIVDHFTSARSGISIISESGLMMKTTAGAVEAKTAFMLDGFQCAHSNGYTKSHGYSKSEDSLASIRAMAMSVISESTPDQLFEAYSDSGALKSGYLPRQICLRLEKNVTQSNRHIIHELSPKLVERFHDLCEMCSMVQSESDPKAHILVFAEGLAADYHDYYDKSLVLRDQHAGSDDVKSVMASRMAQKAVRLAGIATVFNKSSSCADNLVITKQEWEWAKAFINYEYERVSSSLSGIAGDQLMDSAAVAVYNRIFAILDDTISDKKCKVARVQQHAKQIPYSKLKIACKNNPNINRLTDKYGAMKTGLDKVLSDMQDKGAIKVLDIDPFGRSPKVIKVLNSINDYMRGMI